MGDQKYVIKSIVFPGVQNLPNFAADAQGYFSSRDLRVEMTFTANSEQQRERLANDEFDIAHSAIDNSFAMVDVARQDVVAFVGLDHGFNRLIVQPDIGSYEDLRGRILGVDAPDTAFALLAYDILQRKGVARGEYSVHAIGATRLRLEALTSRRIDFAMLNLPFALFALEAGLKAFDDDPLEAIGAYQSTAGFAKRDWTQRNRSALVRYIAGYVEGLRWSLNPANRARAADLLCQRMQIPLAVAEQCCQIILDPAAGFAKDAKLNLQGVAKALELRASFAGDGRERPAERYIDESFYRSALETL